MAENNLYSQELWNTTYSNKAFRFAPESDPLVVKMRTFLPGGPGDALEIGCCPGTYLGHLGLMGYTVHGLDLSPSVHETARALQGAGIDCGDFFEEDFYAFCKRTPRKYTVVASFGFIEHFTDFEKAFFLHTKLMDEKGFLIVTFPNFRGSLQYALHSLFDQAGLNRHNTHAMDVSVYAKMAAALKMKILYAGYFGGFGFWTGADGRIPDNAALQALYKGVVTLLDAKAVCGDSPEWSIYGGIILQK